MLNVLIVGCGNIAGGFDHDRPGSLTPFSHAGAYTAHGGFSLAACVEPDQEKRDAFMRRWSILCGFSSMAEARASSLTFDVISICSPTAAHYEDVVLALQMKPHLVFCEKPVTMSVSHTRDLVDRCALANVSLAVNYTRRWDPEVIRLASELRDGVWGPIRSVSGVYNKGIVNNGSHMIDLLHLLLGRLELVHAGPVIDDMLEGDPSIPFVLTTASGVTVQLNCGHAQDYSLFELELVTGSGVISMEDGGLSWRLRKVVQSPNFSGYRALDEGVRKPGGLPRATLNAVTEIYQVVTRGGSLSSSGGNALEAQTLCESLRQRKIALPLSTLKLD